MAPLHTYLREIASERGFKSAQSLATKLEELEPERKDWLRTVKRWRGGGTTSLDRDNAELLEQALDAPFAQYVRGNGASQSWRDEIMGELSSLDGVASEIQTLRGEVAEVREMVARLLGESA